MSWLPLYHDMGLLSSFLIPLSVGAKIVSMDAFEWVARPEMQLAAIEQYGGTFCWLPNFAFKHMARVKAPGARHDLGSMRAFISCSEPCKAETFDAFLEAFGENNVRREMLQCCYAMAETVFAVSQSALGRPVTVAALDGAALDLEGAIRPVVPGTPGARLFVSNGTPIAGLEVAISTTAGMVPWVPGADTHVSGEVMVRGEFVFSGYYRNEDDTRAAFQEGWYGTGDIGFFAAGDLYICGRKKELLIVNGRNFYATDVEEAASRVPGVKPGRAVVFGLYDDRSQSEAAILVAETDFPAEEWPRLRRAVKQEVFTRLELTLQTVNLRAPGWLVKTTSGKISRKENARRYAAELAEAKKPVV